MRASELLKRIIEHNALGRHQAVIRPLEMLLEKRPEHPRALWEYAQALEGLGDTDGAIRSLEVLHRVAPGARKPWQRHARLLRSASEQSALLERALEHHPGDKLLLNMLTSARQQMADETPQADELKAAQNTELLYDYVIHEHPSAAPKTDPQDPDDALARQLATEIRAMQDVVDPEYRPVEMARFDWAARWHARRCARAMQALGYRLLGDFTPRHLEGSLGSAVLMRFLVAKDQRSYAICYHLPASGKTPLQRLLAWLRRRPDGMAVVELQSELEDGDFVITNNAGESDLFEYGPKVLRQSLAADSSLHQLITTHQTAALQHSREAGHSPLKPFSDLIDIVASESRLQSVKADYRHRIGLATDDELQRILGKKYVRYGPRVRRHLNRMSAVAD